MNTYRGRPMQEAHQGVSKSGVHGLFTGNYMAWPFFANDERWNEMTHEQRVAWAERIGFNLTGETRNV